MSPAEKPLTPDVCAVFLTGMNVHLQGSMCVLIAKHASDHPDDAVCLPSRPFCTRCSFSRNVLPLLDSEVNSDFALSDPAFLFLIFDAFPGPSVKRPLLQAHSILGNREQALFSVGGVGAP